MPANGSPGGSVEPPAAGHDTNGVAGQSGWQLAERAWHDAGISWEEPPGETTAPSDPYAPDSDPYATHAYTADPFPPAVNRYRADPDSGTGVPRGADDEYGSDPGHSDQAEGNEFEGDPHPTRPEVALISTATPDLGPGPWPVQSPAARPGFRSGQPGPRNRHQWVPPAFAAPPLSAPVAAAVPPGAAPDELFRAWQGSVRQASGRRRRWGRVSRPARRARGWQAARVVPAAVIVTVGAGALLMLTGRANELLAERGASAPLSTVSPGFSAGLTPALSTLSGYPGQHGPVSVAALWSAVGLTVAVGYADNHPAIWRRTPDGNWSLVSAAVLGGPPGHLTGLAEGPLGWIAVGQVTQNGTTEPVAYQSADGVSWSTLPALTGVAGTGAQFLGVAAGPGGYLVAGRQGSGTSTSAAFWWSGDLRGWTNGGGTGNAGSVATAVASVGDGFVAVGSEMTCHTIWTSPDGRKWTQHDLAKPDDAQSATLRSVAAAADGQIVAAGSAVRNGSDLPVVVAADDDGGHLTQVVLTAGEDPATVTAVTATRDGFVAAGLAGPLSAKHTVTWTSANGLTWSAASPLTAAGSSEVTALTDTSAALAGSSTSRPAAHAVTAAAQHGAATTLLSVPAP
jgi:hypothetical protein